MIKPSFVYNNSSAYVSFDTNTIVQGGPIALGGGITTIGQLAVFDSSANGVNVTGGLVKSRNPALGGSANLWGSGNTGIGLSVSGGVKVSLTGGSITPTITGTGGDFQLDDITPATGVRSFRNDTGVFTSTIATTWDNWVAAAPGGFNYTATNYLTGMSVQK